MNMSFGSILWQINPSELKISCERSISKRLVPGFGESIQELGKGKRTVTGKGYLVGESCHREFMRLEEVFTLGCRDTLFLPGREPFDAMLTKLEYIGLSGDNALEYAFVFTESPINERQAVNKVLYAKDKESLWDYSWIYSVPMDVLVRKNRHIRFINCLNEGEKVII